LAFPTQIWQMTVSNLENKFKESFFLFQTTSTSSVFPASTTDHLVLFYSVWSNAFKKKNIFERNEPEFQTTARPKTFRWNSSTMQKASDSLQSTFTTRLGIEKMIIEFSITLLDFVLDLSKNISGSLLLKCNLCNSECWLSEDFCIKVWSVKSVKCVVPILFNPFIIISIFRLT
jgi:hypothetical protein